MINAELHSPHASIPEGVAVLPGVTWPQFQTLTQVFQRRRIRLTYLNGILETLSPISKEHESGIGLLVELYLRSKGIRFYKTGGFTLEKSEYSSGETDESYCLDRDKDDILSHAIGVNDA